MTNAEARVATALLLSVSAVVVLLLARRDALVSLVLAALDRFHFHLDGRGLLDLATKRNMVLLCHAILLVMTSSSATPASSAPQLAAAPRQRPPPSLPLLLMQKQSAPLRPCPAPPPPSCGAGREAAQRTPTSTRAAAVSSNAASRGPRRRLQPAAAAAAVAAAAIPCSQLPALTEEPEQAAEQQQQPLISKETVLVEKAATKCGSDRRVIVADNVDEMDANAAGEEGTPELADDRRIQEFIDKQWSKIRQESLKLQVVVTRQISVRVPTSGDTAPSHR
ncbi:unnamed protein product [Urochloa humidicola]